MLSRRNIHPVLAGAAICAVLSCGFAYSASEYGRPIGDFYSKSLALQIGEDGFSQHPLGAPVSTWFTVDLEGDGLWELAIRTSEVPTRVGVYDPRVAEWVDGPRALPVIGDEWGVRDFDEDGSLEYVYRVGTEVHLYDPTVGTDSLLWTAPPTLQKAIFWGFYASDSEAVALLYQAGTEMTGVSWAWGIRDMWTGQHLFNIPGEPLGVRRVHGYPHPMSECLVIHAASSYINQTPHSGSQSYSQSIRIVDSMWSVISVTDLPGARLQGANPVLALWGLAEAGLIHHSTSTYPIVFWKVIPALGGLQAATTYFGAISLATGGIIWNTPCSYGTTCLASSWTTTRAAPFDMDLDGTDEIVSPNWKDSSWQIWDASTGELDTVQTDRSIGKLDAATLLDEDKRSLFYVSDSTLYIYQYDVNTGVFDDPEFPLGPAVAATISSHPNPFNSAVTFSWSVIATTLTIFNVLGQAVIEIPVDGRTSVTWDGCNSQSHECPSGIYIAQVASRDFTASTKIVLLR